MSLHHSTRTWKGRKMATGVDMEVGKACDVLAASQLSLWWVPAGNLKCGGEERSIHKGTHPLWLCFYPHRREAAVLGSENQTHLELEEKGSFPLSFPHLNVRRLLTIFKT